MYTTHIFNLFFKSLFIRGIHKKKKFKNMFIVFAQQVFSKYNVVCESPLKHAEPLKDHKLISMGIMTRHGMRTTIEEWLPHDKAGFWQCQSPYSYSPRQTSLKTDGKTRRYLNSLNDDSLLFEPSCHGGELTLQGMRQHAELGKFYRKYLVDELGFLPKKFDKDLIGLRSSKVERCIKSLQSFVSELYPPAAPGEELEIITGSANHEPLYPSSKQCKYLSEAFDNFTKSEEFNKRKEAGLKVYGELFTKLNITKDTLNWMFVGDFIYSYVCNDHDIPEWLTDDMVKQATTDVSYFAYGFFDYTPGYNGASIWRAVLRGFDAFLEKRSTKKFWMYSAHDTTIGAALNSFGITDNKLPPFRSHMAMELWEDSKKDVYIRLVLNGEPVIIPSEKTDVIKYARFKELLHESVTNYCIEELP